MVTNMSDKGLNMEGYVGPFRVIVHDIIQNDAAVANIPYN